VESVFSVFLLVVLSQLHRQFHREVLSEPTALLCAGSRRRRILPITEDSRPPPECLCNPKHLYLYVLRSFPRFHLCTWLRQSRSTFTFHSRRRANVSSNRFAVANPRTASKGLTCTFPTQGARSENAAISYGAATAPGKANPKQNLFIIWERTRP
jgi:hypothetical protein